MDLIAMRLGSRTVYWEIEVDQAAQLAQLLVSAIGPAKGEAVITPEEREA